MKPRSIQTMIALPLVVALGCAGSKGTAAPSDGGADGASSPLGASCNGCGRSKIGSPTWEPSEAALFAARDGSGGANFIPLVSSILGPRHQYYEAVAGFGPAVAHAGPYTGELAAMLAARALTPQQSFVAADLNFPAGIGLIVAIVPGAGAPRGSSFDFAEGPIIPNPRFPLTTIGRVFRDGATFDPNILLETRGYDEFMPPIDADGPSHLFLPLLENDLVNLPRDPANPGNGPPPQPVIDGEYQFKLAITDSGGSGWVLDLPFTVGAPGHGDAGPGANGDAGSALACEGTPPARALITDFSDAMTATANQTGLTFGTPPNITGGAFSYAARGVRAPIVKLISVSGPDAGATPADAGASASPFALGVGVDPGTVVDPAANGFFGFGLAFQRCVDGSAYQGVQFTLDSLEGDFSSCNLRFAVNFSEDDIMSGNPAVASCTASVCTPPASSLITTTGRLTFAFDDLVNGGSPVATLNRKTITGLQWHMNVPDLGSCFAAFSIRDISFVTQIEPPSICALPLHSPIIVGAGAPLFPPFTVEAPNLAAPVVDEVVSTASADLRALEVTADPGPTTDPLGADVGFGVYVCADVSAYTGVRFTAAGDLGTCTLALSAVPTVDLTPHVAIGTCTKPPCAPPRSPPLAIGTHVVLFSDMTGGAPLATVDPTDLGALEWILTAPTDGVTALCHATLRITDVSFVAN